MLGLGETRDELAATMREPARVDVEILTLGQYLRPSERAAPAGREVLSPTNSPSWR